MIFAFRPARIRTGTGDRKPLSEEPLLRFPKETVSCLRSGRLRRLLTRLQRARPSAGSPSLSRTVSPCRSIGEACGLPTTGKYRPPQELTLPRNCRARAAGSAESTHPSTGAKNEVQRRSRRTASWLHPESGTSTKHKACYRSSLHQHPRFSVSRLPLGTEPQYRQRLPYLKKKKKTLSRLPDCEKKPDPGKLLQARCRRLSQPQLINRFFHRRPESAPSHRSLRPTI